MWTIPIMHDPCQARLARGLQRARTRDAHARIVPVVAGVARADVYVNRLSQLRKVGFSHTASLQLCSKAPNHTVFTFPSPEGLTRCKIHATLPLVSAQSPVATLPASEQPPSPAAGRSLSPKSGDHRPRRGAKLTPGRERFFAEITPKPVGSPLQIRARPVRAYLQWMCPDCAYIMAGQRLAWRHARISCAGCRRRFTLGLHFSRTLDQLPPFNARFASEPYARHVNTLGSAPAGVAAIGRLVGSISFECPSCGHWEEIGTGIDRKTGVVGCPSCGDSLFLALTLFRATNAPHITPYDWVPPERGHEAV